MLGICIVTLEAVWTVKAWMMERVESLAFVQDRKNGGVTTMPKGQGW